jgi:hypothetical protein
MVGERRSTVPRPVSVYFVPYPESGHTYFGVRLIVGHEYFYWTGENVMPFPESDTQCRCGEQLAYWTGFVGRIPSQRIRPACPNCGSAFDISRTAAEILNPWTGESRSVVGGMAFRFALQVDAHKNFPHEELEFRRFRLNSGIHELWRARDFVPSSLGTWILMIHNLGNITAAGCKVQVSRVGCSDWVCLGREFRGGEGCLAISQRR